VCDTAASFNQQRNTTGTNAGNSGIGQRGTCAKQLKQLNREEIVQFALTYQAFHENISS
jgi:hypothetical protein